MNLSAYRKPALVVVFIIAALVVLIKTTATAISQEVKYCKNYQTGEIIVLEASYPCPYPTVEI